MNLLDALIQAIHGGGHPQSQDPPHQAIANQIQSRQPIQPIQQRPMQPMIPTGQPIPQQRMNSYDPQTRALAQIYQQNPMDPRVSHIDPKIFGYAPDERQLSMGHPATPRPGASYNGVQMASSMDDNLQGYNQDDLSNGLQGGVVNQGYIPIQNSGFGGQGYAANLQPTGGNFLNQLRNRR